MTLSAATFDNRVYPGGLTYSGHPLACAAAVATITAMEDEKIVENAERVGAECGRQGGVDSTGDAEHVRAGERIRQQRLQGRAQQALLAMRSLNFCGCAVCSKCDGLHAALPEANDLCVWRSARCLHGRCCYRYT